MKAARPSSVADVWTELFLSGLSPQPWARPQVQGRPPRERNSLGKCTEIDEHLDLIVPCPRLDGWALHPGPLGNLDVLRIWSMDLEWTGIESVVVVLGAGVIIAAERIGSRLAPRISEESLLRLWKLLIMLLRLSLPVYLAIAAVPLFNMTEILPLLLTYLLLGGTVFVLLTTLVIVRIVNGFIEHATNLQHILDHTRNISASSDFGRLTGDVRNACASLVKAATSQLLFFVSGECFIRSNLASGFYEVSADRVVAPCHTLSELQERFPLLARVEDPRTHTVLAVVAFSECDPALFAREKPVLNILAGSVANAIAAIRFQEAMAVVEGKSAEMAMILENITQGICTFGIDFRINPEYSKHLERILATEGLANRSLVELLFEGAVVSGDEIAQFKTVVEASIGEELFTFNVNRNSIPREVVRRMPDGAMQYLELDCMPIRCKDGTVERIMISLRDVTQVKRLKDAADAAGAEMRLIEEVIAVEKKDFDGFAELTVRQITDAGAILAKGSLSDQDFVLLKRILHTMKGNCRGYGFSQLSNAVHLTESRLTAARTEGLAQVVESFGALKTVFEKYRHVNFVKLGRSEVTSEVSPTFLSTLKSLVERTRAQVSAEAAGAQDSAAWESLQWFLEHPAVRVFGELVGQMRITASALALKLEKPVPRLEVNHANWFISSKHYLDLMGLFNHLVTNSLDHGLTRDEPGRIRMEIHEQEHAIVLRYSDSGPGLNLPRLRKCWRERSPDAEGSDSELAGLVWESGLSTRDEVSETSGRGVGLNAVMATMQALGGKIELVFTRETDRLGHRPFELVLTFSREVFYRRY